MPDAKLEITELSAVVQPDIEEMLYINALLTLSEPRGKLKKKMNKKTKK
jgi:hypothetical protein